MKPVALNHAQKIRDLHLEARELAGRAVGKAIEAGRLLSEAKQALGHGEFGPWVETHCGFTARTAQRYMALHREPRRLPGHVDNVLGVKSDSVSLLDWIEPAADEWTVIKLHDGTQIDITPSTQHPGYLHVAVLEPTADGGGDVTETKRPVRPSMTKDYVQHIVGERWQRGVRETTAHPTGFSKPLWAFLEAA